jgi:hypothetical protein
MGYALFVSGTTQVYTRTAAGGPYRPVSSPERLSRMSYRGDTRHSSMCGSIDNTPSRWLSHPKNTGQSLWSLSLRASRLRLGMLFISLLSASNLLYRTFTKTSMQVLRLRDQSPKIHSTQTHWTWSICILNGPSRATSLASQYNSKVVQS